MIEFIVYLLINTEPERMESYATKDECLEAAKEYTEQGIECMCLGVKTYYKKEIET